MKLKIGVNNLFLLTFPLFLFSACTSPKVVYQTQIEYVFVKPSSALLENCKEIEQKELKTNYDLLIAYNNILFDYYICSNKVKTINNFYLEYDKTALSKE